MKILLHAYCKTITAAIMVLKLYFYNNSWDMKVHKAEETSLSINIFNVV